MQFIAVTPSLETAPWLLRRAEARRLSTAAVLARLAALPPPGRVGGFNVAEPRPAALLVPLGEADGEPVLVVTKRPETMLHNRNDWVFPGGRLDPAHDADTRDTALREACEELGLGPGSVTLLGRLSTRGPITSGYLLDVYVGRIDVARLAPDPREVADWALVRLADFAADGAYRESHNLPEVDPGPAAEGVIVPTGRLDKRLPFFEVRPGEYMWGLQGQVLHELLAWLLPAP